MSGLCINQLNVSPDFAINGYQLSLNNSKPSATEYQNTYTSQAVIFIIEAEFIKVLLKRVETSVLIVSLFK